MSFESGTVSLRMFTLPRRFEDGVIERFADHSLPPLESLGEDMIIGWVTGHHLFDRTITEDTAYPSGYLRLTLVKAERKIPSSLLKAELKQEELLRLEMKQADYVSRHRSNTQQAWKDWLSSAAPGPALNDAGGIRSGVNSYLNKIDNVPKVGIALSGGSFRATVSRANISPKLPL